MIRGIKEVLGLGIALVAAAGSLAWFGWYDAGVERRAEPGDRAALSGTSYVPVPREVRDGGSAQWLPPVAQKQGGAWVYEVFTPPEIIYDSALKRFSVSAPEGGAAPEQATSTAFFGIELLSVNRPLFRLQLIGYAGGDGNYCGVFENAATTETFLGREGSRFAALDVSVVEFSVQRLPVRLPESMTTFQLVANARVRDELSGETVNLTSAARSFTDEPGAILAVAGEPAHRTVRERDIVELAGARYTILSVQPDPPSLVVGRHVVGQPDPEPRTLVVAATLPPSTAPTP